ncbi:MAG: sigma-70 family RNA polymerase sigma factor [candidate division NC10 bacterium]
MPQSQQSDEALFRQIQTGKRDAFAALVERYQRRAFAVALRLLGRRQDAEDAVQQAFLRLYEARAQYHPKWRVSTWFYRILTNTCVDELRHRRPMLELQEKDEPLVRGPDHSLELAERDRLLHAALATVPMEARIVLTLYYADGRSYQEIGAIRGISVNTVKTHLRRGRLALRRALRARGVDEA